MSTIEIRRGGSVSVLDLPVDQVWVLEDQITIRQIIELAGMREALADPAPGCSGSAVFRFQTHNCIVLNQPMMPRPLHLVGMPAAHGADSFLEVLQIVFGDSGPVIPDSIREVLEPQN